MIASLARKAICIAVFFLMTAASCSAFAGMLDVSDAKEGNLGKDAAEEIIRYYGLVENDAEIQRMQAVGERIISICGRKNIEYHFYILDTDIINAFALPGGYVFMTKGIMDFVDDDDELASVMAHEITHVVRRHGVSIYKKEMKNALINFLVLVLTRDPNAVMAGQMVEQERADIFGRTAENEADSFGLEYVVKAGYNPDSFISFFEKMKQYDSHRPNLLEDYFDSHPPMEERIENAKNNYKRLGLTPPTAVASRIEGRLHAAEICKDESPCLGEIEGPNGVILTFGDPGRYKTPFDRAKKTVDVINRLLDSKLELFEIKKTNSTNGPELMLRNTRVLYVLPGDLKANNAENADVLLDRWVESLKIFIWNDFLKDN
ncbi:MAG TPA: M48 family metalloprotease [bacterium]|nr:M48 family metalloprotease [bacterium]